MNRLKILIVSKFLYARGGAETYAINLGEMLKMHNHEVRFFSMSYPENINVDENEYFAKEVSFFQPSLNAKLKAALRVFGIGVRQNYEKLLNDFQPDIVHLNNIHSYLSPIVAELAHKKGIKVIWTVHDYKLICPAYSCLCHGEPCEACIENNKFSVISRKCMKDSLFASLLAWGEIMYWNKNRLSKWTDAFICPSNFMAQKMIKGGYPADKLHTIYNFIDIKKAKLIAELSEEEEIAYVYLGRLSEEKGIEELLKVANQLPYTLYIAGKGPLKEMLTQKYASDKIRFVGHLSDIEIIKLFKRVKFSVIPSIWYENNPLSVIESLCCGTPVLGRNIGGIPELLKISTCNRQFSRNEELSIAITDMFSTCTQIDRNEISTIACKYFSTKQYYQQWLEIARNILS